MAGEINFGLLNRDAPAEAALAPIKGMGAVNALISQDIQNQQQQFDLKNALAEQEAYKQAAQGGTSAPQALMERGLGKQAMAYQKNVGETQQSQMKALAERLPIQREMAKQMALNPSPENIVANVKYQVGMGWMTPQQAQETLNNLSTMSPQQLTAYFKSSATKAEDFGKMLQEQEQRMQGTVPAGYRMTQQGTLEAIPGGPTTTPLAPKELQKREAAYPQAKASVTGYESKADKFIKDIDELLENKSGLDEITGYLAGRTELSAISPAARKALAKYNQIAAKGGFQALQDIREMSKTGGALGNVSNQEGKQLQASFAALDRTQEAGDVRAALEQIKSDIEGSKTRIRETFDETYAYKQGGGTPAAGGTPVTGNSPAAQALARFRASKGQ